jgi:two-component system NarL family response regulator
MTIRVLLADDHRILREALRTILEKESDIKVVGESDNGRATLKAAREMSPDVVVMDVAMPELNGVEATVRMLDRDPRLRVVALSAHSDKRYVLEMLKAGAAGYVTKAAAGTELLRAIRAVAKGMNYLSPDVASAVIGNIKESENTLPVPSSPLGRREREVLQLLAEGHRSQAIAERLCISPATVESHRRNIMRKLNLHSVAELTKYAIREGLTAP